ncbi:hypothetical protein VDGE_06216 [Verticillium dahliae]|uniref:Proline dehydrogenase n=1 Tax=Verticillium dahliae TaxID=27337 RepID=A0A444RPJ0_VERDA|nr:hypothetical protein VDGE_06216 [Verticillium dahliae]
MAAHEPSMAEALNLAQPAAESRLSMPTPIRIPVSGFVGFSIGSTLGLIHGSRIAQLQFRAEHAHKMPTSTTGWYLYHKSKNYHTMFGGMREAIRMGSRLGFWTLLAFGLESTVDRYRGKTDFLSTVLSSVSVAGAFSLWNRFSLPTAARTAKYGLLFGLVYGIDSHRDASLIHTSSKNSYHPKVHLHPAAPPANPAAVTPAPAHRAPLSLLPLHMILRSLLTTTISSSRWLLPPSLAIASALAHATHPLLSPDRNPLLRVLLKHTFYAQFCAGETPAEVRRTVSRLKGLGFSGVILGYAREVVMTEAQTRGLSGASETSRRSDEEEVRPWQEGTEQTVRLAEAGDFVALKFTGAGQQALYALSERFPPSAALASAMDSICACAAARGVRLLFDAEQAAVQQGIDDWTLTYQRKYNTVPGRAVIYGTYQAYLKSTPATLTRHLLTAQEQGFTLGVKLVRGRDGRGL